MSGVWGSKPVLNFGIRGLRFRVLVRGLGFWVHVIRFYGFFRADRDIGLSG